MKNDKLFDPESAPTFWVNQVSRLLTRHFERRLRPFDAGMAYLPVIFGLEQSENGSLLQKQLAEIAYVEQPTMAALLTRMKRDGLIEREVHLTDKRASQICLTEKAKQRIPSIKEEILAVAEQAMTGFTDEDRSVLIGLLQRVAKNLNSST